LRVLGRTDSAYSVSFFFFLASIPLAALGCLVVHHRPPALFPVAYWPHVLGFGVTAATGQFFLTMAYAVDRAAVVAAASYTGPLWAVIIDALYFRTYPDPLAILGGLLIVGPGLLLLFDRQTETPAPPTGIET
jgi:drug/metabolite transporter (DMT)-like permease